MNPDLEPGRLEVARQRDLEVGDQLDAADLHLELNGEMPYDDPYAKTYTNRKSSTRKLKDKPPAKTKPVIKKRRRTGRGTLPLEDASDAVAAQIVAAARARAVSTPLARCDSMTSSKSPWAWFEKTNTGERNVLMCATTRSGRCLRAVWTLCESRSRDRRWVMTVVPGPSSYWSVVGF